MTLIIGIGYKAQHGKDTVAATIIAERSDKFDIKRYAFADILKVEMFHALVNRVDPFWHFLSKFEPTDAYFDSVLIPKPDNPYISDPVAKVAWINEHKASLRHLLQVFGSEYRRRQDPFYWVRALGAVINRDKPQVALISDMRFMNETFFVKANDGFTIQVQRDGFDNGVSNHVSEQQLADYTFDYNITVADGALDELKADAVAVFDEIILNNTPLGLQTEDFTEASFEEAA